MNTFYIVFLLVLFYFIYNHNETFIQDNISCQNMNITIFKQFNNIGVSWYNEKEINNTEYKLSLINEDENDNNINEYTYKSAFQTFHTFIFPKNYNSNKQCYIKLTDGKGINCQSEKFYIDNIKNNNNYNINYIKCNPDSTYKINKGERKNMCKLDTFPMSKDDFIESDKIINGISSVLEQLKLSESKKITLDGTQ